MKKYFLLIFLLIIIPVCNAATSNTDSSAIFSKTGSVEWILCPVTTVNNITLKQTDQTITNLGPGDCITKNSPKGAWVAGFIVVVMQMQCPADHPYMQEVQEIWAGQTVAAGGVWNIWKCCTSPKPPLSIQMKWCKPDNNGNCPVDPTVSGLCYPGP